ncbi:MULTISPECIES: biotin/lipoyl-containing protein [Halobacillus]|uniref:biotin/lipoyl-containing protein n=1 Tax=Halobacillus TaxID=45667 RepID=UPI0009A59639|nr:MULTISPECIES: biotin/lipoyl-containing protein [Halobacillus]
MTIHEVMPIKWDSREIVTSPIIGKVEDVCVKFGERIYEGQPLLVIKKEQGGLEQIAAGITGVIDALNVQKGDMVIHGHGLIFIRDDLD